MITLERNITIAQALFERGRAVGVDHIEWNASIRLGLRNSEKAQSTDRIQNLSSRLGKIFSVVQARQSLSTGGCMEIIWSNLTPCPATAEDQEYWSDLWRFANTFDNLAWRSELPLARLGKMRQSIVDICTDLDTSSGAIEQLSEVSPSSAPT